MSHMDHQIMPVMKECQGTGLLSAKIRSLPLALWGERLDERNHPPIGEYPFSPPSIFSSSGVTLSIWNGSIKSRYRLPYMHKIPPPAMHYRYLEPKLTSSMSDPGRNQTDTPANPLDVLLSIARC